MIGLLAEQRAALAASCEGYDRGNEWEAARLATAVFTLIHDGGKILSLLSQLGLRASLRFVSTNRVVDKPGMVAMSPPLLIMVGHPTLGMQFRPRLGSEPGPIREIQFPAWWEKEVIYKDHSLSPLALTRRRLVFALRHQDGGGHVGELTDTAYVRFKGGGGWFGGVGNNPPKAMDTGVAASMRQVAWEITETLKQLGEVT